MNTQSLSWPRTALKNLAEDSRPGFTIVEMLVVVGLIAVISTVAFTIFRGASRGQAKTADDLQMQSRMLGTQNELLRIIRDGKAFIIPRLGEDSPSLCLIDKVSDIQAVVAMKDEQLSKKTGKVLYKLIHYQVETEGINLDSPAAAPASGRIISDHIENITFRPSSANSVNVSILFSTETRQFQIMFEGGLMNAGNDDQITAD